MDKSKISQLLIESAELLESDNITLNESIDKDIVKGFIGLGALFAIAIYGTTNAIKHSINNRKLNKKMTYAKDHVYIYSDYSKKLIAIISKAKFIKCKKGFIEFLENSSKTSIKYINDYEKLINRLNKFEAYMSTHKPEEYIAEIKSIINTGKDIVSKNKFAIESYKIKNIESEWVDCDKEKIISYLKKVISAIDLNKLNSVHILYDKLYSSLYDSKIVNFMACDNPDYDKLMLFMEDYEFSLIEPLFNIVLSEVKVQLTGKSINENEEEKK